MSLSFALAYLAVLVQLEVHGAVATVNPDNQAAVKILEASMNSFLTMQASRGTTLLSNQGCEYCAANSLGVIVRSDNRYGITASKLVAATATCNAEQGSAYSCSIAGGGMQIDGTWAVGHVTIGRYNIPSLQGTPVAEGKFTLTVRNFNAHWTGAFRRGESRFEYTTDYSAAMACNNVPVRPDVDFGFGITRTSGSESPEYTPLIEELARKTVNHYYCYNLSGRMSRSLLQELTKNGVEFRMTWGAL